MVRAIRRARFEWFLSAVSEGRARWRRRSARGRSTLDPGLWYAPLWKKLNVWSSDLPFKLTDINYHNPLECPSMAALLSVDADWHETEAFQPVSESFEADVDGPTPRCVMIVVADFLAFPG